METTYNYDVFNGTANDPDPGPDPFLVEANIYYFQMADGRQAATKLLHVWALDNNLLIRFSFVSVPLAWGGPIQINAAPQSQDFYHSAQAFQVVSAVAGAVAWYQVLGMW